MNRPLSALLIAGLLLAAGGARAQAADEDWISYRDAYRAMLGFEKYGKPKHFIQVHLQVMAREKGVPVDGLKLTLQSRSGAAILPLDAAGRTVFPFSKAAYDDNAALVLNHKVAQYRFRARVSILPRADGVYELADLRSACEEALNYQRYAEPAAVSNKKCVGVRLSYGRQTEAPRLKANGRETTLALNDGAAFPDDVNDGFRIANLRFADTPDKAQLISPAVPVAIAALIE